MSSGDARRSQPAISFNVIKKYEETSTQISTKRLQEDTEILISNSSMSSIIQEEDNINSNLLTEAPLQNHNTDGLAIKLNCLKEKPARYTSHRDFFSKCAQESLASKGLEITLEPTIGNFDQDFVNNCYTNLQQFSIVLMKQIVAYCEKTAQKIQKKH